jgi:TolB-like protein
MTGRTRRCRRRALFALLGAAFAAGAARPGWAQATTPAVVVWDFDDQTPAGLSALGRDRLDYLRRALGEQITAALIGQAGIAVVERQRLRDVLAEQKLAGGELADADARLRLGRIAGAARMVFGGFFAVADDVQVNVRVVETATSRVVFSDEFNARVDAVMQHAEVLARRVAHALGGGSAVPRAYPARLWQAYDRALALSDAGHYEQAVAALQALLAEDKEFTPAERQLVALLDKMRRR